MGCSEEGFEVVRREYGDALAPRRGISFEHQVGVAGKREVAGRFGQSRLAASEGERLAEAKRHVVLTCLTQRVTCPLSLYR